MCGIAGVLGLNENLGPEDRDEVRGMTQVLPAKAASEPETGASAAGETVG